MKKLLLYIVLVLSMFAVVLAAPVPEPVIDNFAGGITLELNDYPYHPINEEYYLHVHLYDTDTGLLSNNNESECFYHLYAERVNWRHLIFNGTMSSYGIGFESTINESYFNETGDYSFLIWCDQPIDPQAKEGGYEKFYFSVYEDEKVFNYFYEITFLVVVVLLLILAISMKMSILGIITSIVLLITGLVVILNSFMLGLLLFLAGFMLSLYFGLIQQS